VADFELGILEIFLKNGLRANFGKTRIILTAGV
jgi:hypothetical protein